MSLRDKVKRAYLQKRGQLQPQPQPPQPQLDVITEYLNEILYEQTEAAQLRLQRKRPRLTKKVLEVLRRARKY